MTSTTISRWWNSSFHDFPGFVAFLSLVASRESHSGPANVAVLHGLFESVHYVIPRGLDQTASVAQLAEQLICNQQVAGSTPAASSACPASRRRRLNLVRSQQPRRSSTTVRQQPTSTFPTCQPEVTSSQPTLPAGSYHGRTTQAHNPSIHRCPCPFGREHEGSFPSGQRGQTVNLMDFSFAGSNPALPTAHCAL
jgi:hypothetical protein